MGEKIICIEAPCGIVDTVERQVKVTIWSKPFYCSANVVFRRIELCAEEHAVETETESFARTLLSAEEFAQIYIIAYRNGKISEVETGRRRVVGGNEYATAVGKLKIITLGPAVGGYLGIELIS